MSDAANPPDNGILAAIPGQFVAAATEQLGPPEIFMQEPAIRETEMDVPGFGRVRFTARRLISRKGKSTLYYWTVVRAVVIS